MGSPFSTAQAYTNASGVYHSFSGDPVAVAICLVLSLTLTGITIYKAFKIHH